MTPPPPISGCSPPPRFLNNALAHPLRALAIGVRRLLLNRNYGDPLWDGGEIPVALQAFAPGERLPWKGVDFRVGKIVGGRLPCIILVPVDATKGQKLKSMRRFRRIARRVTEGA